MKRKNKGFTLIELMIVLAIIGVLSVVLIPKALPMKDAAKNNAVQANVYIVRSFLENRAGSDKTSIENDTKNLMLSSSVALSHVQSKIKTDMDIAYTANKDIKNPFNNNTIIDISSADVLANLNIGSSAVIIGYNVGGLPSAVSSISTTIKTSGVIVITVYQTGYVVYGVDSSGEIVQPTLVSMPKINATGTNLPQQEQVVTPTFNYTINNTGVSYTLSCKTVGAIIKYTTDGTSPNASPSSLEYKTPINVSNTTTLKAYAANSGMSDSNFAITTYTPQALTPTINYTFDFTGGVYTLSCATPNSIIRYTTDGTQPILTSPKYTGPITAINNKIINAYAVVPDDAANAGLIDSNVASTTYILPTTPIPTTSFSFSGNFAVDKKIVKGSNVTFSVILATASLGETMNVTVTDDNGVVINPNSDGTYTFIAPNIQNKVCTITATLKTSTEKFEGKLILTTK